MAAHSLWLAGAGYGVAALDIDAARAEETASAIGAVGGRSIALGVDVADVDAVVAAAGEVEANSAR